MADVDLLLSAECLDCFEEFGPPPDDILSIPPPPLPYFIQLTNHNETTLCNNQCIWAPSFNGLEFVEVTHQGLARDGAWYFIVGASCIGVLILGGLVTLLLFSVRSRINVKNTVQATTTTVVRTNKDCESVLYPFPPTAETDGRVLWATLTPSGTTHHYTAPGTHAPEVTPTFSNMCKPSLPPPDPPISFDNTGFVDSDSQTPLMESYQLNELIDSDVTSNSSTLRKTQRPRVSTPTRIENPNLPPLNLHPHRSLRRATIQRRDSDIQCSSPT
ncbi:hypothetical protein RUM43_013793 [Polyplax serrata]|uniref:Uncharacterized protein n=1 Tax=Polyplax serrata TaxID=468196 RepID=A0AAN8NXD0_POLSC